MQLVDKNGNPLSSASFAKAPSPQLGEKFAPRWANEWDNRLIRNMPGYGAVQFDLSKLTLADFRTMRDHYQINAALGVMSFMLHQIDWKIECSDPKIRAFVQDNMDQMWTNIIKACSQAHWAGYAPCVLQWENDPGSGRVRLTKIKDLIPETSAVNWKFVDGYAPPGRLPPKIPIYDGIKVWGQEWPVPSENCVTPNTKILTADLTWVDAGSLHVGDEIIAFDEEATPRQGRKYRTAKIVVNNPGNKHCLTVSTDVGSPITASDDHPFLVRRKPILTGERLATTAAYRDDWTWVKARDLKVGDRLAWFAEPWGSAEESWEAGYIAGIFDGEGCLNRAAGGSYTLSFTQRPGWVLDRAADILSERGFKYTVHENGRDNCCQLTILGGRREIMRFLATFQPERIGQGLGSKLWDDCRMTPERSVSYAVVTGIEDVGDREIASIQTSTGTFITGGYNTHNTFWYPLLMENGDMYGRKLLRAAFTSWYFSLLIHMFANRYFERFGEPVPVGRAPYEDEITVNVDGTPKKINGAQLMLNVLQSLRNRSAVVLPNDRTQIGTGSAGKAVEYDFDIQYLESQMRGADFERYLMRLDEEMSLAMFTPLLVLRTADVGSYNLGSTHWVTYQNMLNALAADMKTYIDAFILSRMVDFNFGTNAARATITFRKMGSDKMPLITAIMQALIPTGRVMPDLQELGDIAGLSFEEIQVLTTDGPQSGGTGKPADPQAKAATGGKSKKAGNSGGTGKAKKKTANASLVVGDIAKRVASQIRKRITDGSSDFTGLSFGYEKAFVEALVIDEVDDSPSVRAATYALADAFLGEASGIVLEMTQPELETYLEKVLANCLEFQLIEEDEDV